MTTQDVALESLQSSPTTVVLDSDGAFRGRSVPARTSGLTEADGRERGDVQKRPVASSLSVIFEESAVELRDGQVIIGPPKSELGVARSPL